MLIHFIIINYISYILIINAIKLDISYLLLLQNINTIIK